MRWISSLIAMLALSTTAAAVPTEITVRVLSKDGKFIGSSNGGVRVTLSDADTGEILAQGLTEGGNGDTDRILETPRKRGVALATEDAASFRATLDLDRPRRIEASAYGPVVFADAANRVSATQWVVPGKHINAGDGWLLEMPGFFVQIAPPPSAPFALADGAARIPISARVMMMCGCATAPGGVWDSNEYEIEGMLVRAGRVVAQAPLRYSGSAGEYAGELSATEAGAYDAIVYAYDPRNGNTGVAHASVIVAP
jgi:hypothetical protein